MQTSPPAPASAPPFMGWRLMALAYDFFPALGLWFLVALIFTVVHGDAVRGGALGLLEFMALWAICGVYAVASWLGGGQTLGMRPWRLRVVASDGTPATVPALLRRYAMGTVSLLLGGLGFWWAWFDPGQLTWHDRISNTRMVRDAKNSVT